MTGRRYRIACLGLAVVLASLGVALAQTKPPFSERWQNVPPNAPATPPSPPAQNTPAASPAQKLTVSLDHALYLIRSTLLALNDANHTGNYTVLRDLAAPDFQARNSPADLGRIFADLRERHFDLYAAALLAPQLSAVPALDDKGMLRLTGNYPTRPQQINFDLLFQKAGGEWRLFGISIATPQAAPQAQAPRPPRSPSR